MRSGDAVAADDQRQHRLVGLQEENPTKGRARRSKESPVEIEGLQSNLNESLGKKPADEFSSPGAEPLEAKIPAEDKKNLTLVGRKRGGPRSAMGKQRSSQNAIKHGIFSAPVLLVEENAELYRSVLRGLDECFQPEGMLESLLVEKLAITVWRHRRLLEAESAEIYKNMDLVLEEESASGDDTSVMPADIPDATCDDEFWHSTELARLLGIKRAAGPRQCVELLYGIRRLMKGVGFPQEERYHRLFEAIYGPRREGKTERDLRDVFWEYYRVGRSSVEELKLHGLSSERGCEEKFLVELEKEIQRFKALTKKPDTKQPPACAPKRIPVGSLSGRVPKSSELDRLLRYEASLDRSFDRTLSQLERLQRMRAGHSVPPALKLEVCRISRHKSDGRVPPTALIRVGLREVGSPLGLSAERPLEDSGGL